MSSRARYIVFLIFAFAEALALLVAVPIIMLGAVAFVGLISVRAARRSAGVVARAGAASRFTYDAAASSPS